MLQFTINTDNSHHKPFDIAVFVVCHLWLHYIHIIIT